MQEIESGISSTYNMAVSAQWKGSHGSGVHSSQKEAMSDHCCFCCFEMILELRMCWVNNKHVWLNDEHEIGTY